MRRSRIFWLGAHKVLKFTELRDLRSMGLEVFNPAYITPVYDQSADLGIDFDQPTTLPSEIFQELIAYNFFYNQLSPRISEILNEYFDAVIVTLNADWLKAVLVGYKGQVIYRVYGQHSPLSDTLIYNDLWRTVIERPRFTIVPFCSESVEHEHRWFIDLCHHIVPYQIPDDVFSRTNTWSSTPHRREIATSIPNIQNPYFAAAYAQFNSRFPHRVFRIYGPQRSTPIDSRIVGGLQRDTLLDHFAAASGFFYDFRDAVCYLPPIEMMEVGGPVLHAPGSLLSRMYDDPTPGLVRDQDEANTKLRLLLNGDRGFVGEVIAAQDVVRRRYDRAVVRPLFEAAFNALLRPEQAKTPPFAPQISTSRSSGRAAARGTLAILLHVDGLFTHRLGRVYAFEGIPRVVDMIVDTLCRFGHSDVLVTCTRSAEPALHDLFQVQIESGRLRLMPIDCGHELHEVDGFEQRLVAVEILNDDPSIGCVLVPHYYLFPEALLLHAPTILYLPDYFPYLMPDVVFDSSAEKDAENRRVGIAIAEKSAAILTNSRYTASYLENAGFAAPGTKKIRIAPLPLLGSKRALELTADEKWALQSKLGGRRYLLYPTANRPNKQIAFLLRVLAVMRIDEPDLMLVTTCSINSVPAAAEAFHRYGLESDVVFLPGVDEGSLRWLYENAAALCLTSTLEGNFPPQVREALEYGTPVVATRIAPIVEALGDAAADLLLCAPLDLADFCTKLNQALLNPAEILTRQERVMSALRGGNSIEKFYQEFASIIDPFMRPAPAQHSVRELVG